MKVVNSIKELRENLSQERLEKRSIGLVPTMGALHAGHISLVERCVRENDVCVVSVFVNPTQFNDKHDLETYPRTLEADCALLEAAGCHYVFAPSVEEMYPEPDTRVFNLGRVAEVMEGAMRPGHFNGVAQVVSKLFYIVEPDNAYFGEKDFQQIAVIRAMVKQLNIPVKINACPIKREADGLALSSRNTRLTPELRQKAPLIARTLKESTTFAPGKSVQEVIDFVVNTINADPDMRVEYYEIVDGNTLEAIKDWSETDYPVGCITVFCGEVRLIDNIKYNH
ncbi:MAG TPA: pantoate--beta-alanine ligase [Candidatus Parabacteroides intestinipullorum]|uniref:Pantothenate synthetase n=1 Tax=Candidatus Parabacteroides intestinipullorum TaxID=2838723 RepID=A0A9D2BGC6_9BACT|nr:pantoate--beta-alanine ligase [Candidatus Parabacteroides intestinipullorum]